MAKDIPVTIEIIEFLTYYEFSKFAFVSSEISGKISSKDHISISYDYECHFKDNFPSKVIINIDGIDEEFDVIDLNCEEYLKFKISSQGNFRLKHCKNKKSNEEFLSEHRLRSDLLHNEDTYFTEQLNKVLSSKFKIKDDIVINGIGISVNYICFDGLAFSYKKLYNGNFLVNITNSNVEFVPEISGEFISFKKKN